MTSIDLLDDPKALQQLVFQLSHVNAGIKIAALRQSVAFQDKAPLKLILEALQDRREYVRTAATETIESLKPWITDEQWLEALQKPSDLVYQDALAILETQGKDAPFKPIFRASFALKRSLRTKAQHILAMQAQQWSAKKVASFIQMHTEILQKGAPTNRMIALEMLGVLGDKAPVEVFLVALQDDNADVRWTALKMLGTPGERVSITPFLAALQDSEAYVRWTSLELLTEFGKQGHKLLFELIMPLLNDPNARVRSNALKVLDSQEEISIDYFIAAMHDTSESVVHTATIILGKRKNIKAIPTLTEHLLHDPDDSLDDYNEYAWQAIEELYEHIPLDQLIEAFNNGNERVQINAIALLNLLKKRTPVELFLKLLDDKDPQRRRLGIWALSGHLSHIPIEIIANKLKDRDKKVRETAARVLCRRDLEIPADLILPFLDCPENIARAAAVRLLGTRMSIERLLAARYDHKWTVRVAAIEILGTMGEQVPLDVLLEALCDQNLEVCRAAIQALGEQGTHAPINIIIGALLGPRRISSTAIEVLAQLDKRPPYELLLQALKDPRPYIRRMGIEYLQSLQSDAPPPVDAIIPLLQDSDAYIREATIKTLNHWGVIEPAELFVKALADDSYSVREVALSILIKLGGHAPREPLKVLLGDSSAYQFAIKCLQQTHPEVLGEVVEEASNILSGQGTGELLGSIQQAHIAEIIGNMPTPGPLLVNKLVELLDWPHPKVRMTAALALEGRSSNSGDR
ncbi:HEAT repeat domain-containing protein [Ktedonobacter racemifer]|uniref:PBS lyase HEAT domain protein repeat-containing protein n=1 Tax=Ktedonobacter racemifer DSM 44963 TaxID=485913 RepID=D6TW01_KTERA|nr:HEAT repeat domain-containing protein [Ktedonobacter racemifer]EFH84384.1 PBS lyase HEAT domain protein repeat-containing protein [Ktedonobacter racemifer DSM 44963]